jgi:hypothetical protein
MRNSAAASNSRGSGGVGPLKSQSEHSRLSSSVPLYFEPKIGKPFEVRNWVLRFLPGTFRECIPCDTFTSQRIFETPARSPPQPCLQPAMRRARRADKEPSFCNVACDVCCSLAQRLRPAEHPGPILSLPALFNQRLVFQRYSSFISFPCSSHLFLQLDPLFPPLPRFYSACAS